jgi:hypothetical protein
VVPTRNELHNAFELTMVERVSCVCETDQPPLIHRVACLNEAKGAKGMSMNSSRTKVACTVADRFIGTTNACTCRRYEAEHWVTDLGLRYVFSLP